MLSLYQFYHYQILISAGHAFCSKPFPKIPFRFALQLSTVSLREAPVFRSKSYFLLVFKSLDISTNNFGILSRNDGKIRPNFSSTLFPLVWCLTKIGPDTISHKCTLSQTLPAKQIGCWNLT